MSYKVHTKSMEWTVRFRIMRIPAHRIDGPSMNDVVSSKWTDLSKN